MADQQRGAGGAGFEYDSEQGEDRAMEQGVESLGTAAAGAGVAPHSGEGTDLPAGSGHHELHATQHPAFHYSSDAGELKAMEEGTELTEEGEAAARGQGGGETF